MSKALEKQFHQKSTKSFIRNLLGSSRRYCVSLARKLLATCLTKGRGLASAIRVISASLLVYSPRWFRNRIVKVVGVPALWATGRESLGAFNLSDYEKRLCQRAHEQMTLSQAEDKIPFIIALAFYEWGFEIYDEVDLDDDLFMENPNFFLLFFRFPVFFHTQEQFDRAVWFIKLIFNKLESKWKQELDPSRRDRLAWLVNKYFNFVPLLFTGENLRPFASIAGKWVEHDLLARGFRLDCQFPNVSFSHPIRVGVLVRDIAPRTETYIAPCFAAELDPDQYRTTLITLDAPGDSVFDEFVCSQFDEIKPVVEAELDDCVKAIRGMRLDVLIIANTIAAQASDFQQLIAHRLAPKQIMVSAVAPSTTGLSRVDYVITSKGCEPPDDAQDQYTERTLFLEGSFNCFSLGPDDPRVKMDSLSKVEVRLPSKPISFVSGGSLYKLIPQMREVWARLLARVPDSELFIYPFNNNWGVQGMGGQIIERMERDLARHGVAAERLTILPNLDPMQIVKLLQHATVYLDTFPYSGAASFIEPMAAMCPAVGLRGSTQRGMQGASMMEALGLEEMICQTPEEYIDKASSLALNPELRKRMVERMSGFGSHPAFLDVRTFGGEIGRALERVCTQNQPMEAKHAV
jgi:hypothetical protein